MYEGLFHARCCAGCWGYTNLQETHGPFNQMGQILINYSDHYGCSVMKEYYVLVEGATRVCEEGTNLAP